MKQRSLILCLVIVIFGVIALPNVAGWLVRDFMHQTMRLGCDFETASVNPLTGNLVLRNLTIKGSSPNGSLNPNKAETVWAKYSLPQFMYRRLNTPLIAMDGIRIVSCDDSAAELPRFAAQTSVPKLKSSEDIENAILGEKQISIALKQSSVQQFLGNEKARIEKELRDSRDEILRLRKSLSSLNSSPLDHTNRLRSESDAKRIETSISQTLNQTKELKTKVARQESSIVKTIPAAQKTALVDWMSWSDERKNAVQAIDANEVVGAVLSEYARHIIKPMTASLMTTHSISKWSTLEQVTSSNESINESSPNKYDLLGKENRNLPFDYQFIKLRGKTLVGPEPLAMSGTLMKATRSKEFNDFARPTTLELRFSKPTSFRSVSDSSFPEAIRTKATHNPQSRSHEITVQYGFDEPLSINGLDCDPYDASIQAKFVASRPRVELRWEIQDDRWNCEVDLYSSEASIHLCQLNNSAPEQIWAHQVAEKDFAVFRICFQGKLEDGIVDNCNESVLSEYANEIADSFKNFFKRKAETDLVAAQKTWTKESENLIASLGEFQKTANREIRQNLESLEVEIRKEQERLAQALSDPSEIRFSRKVTSDQPAKLSR